MFFTMQLSSVEALTYDNDIDIYEFTYYSGTYVRITAESGMWAGPKAGGGVYTNHQYYYAKVELTNGKAYWATLSLKVNGVVVHSDSYVSTETNPGVYWLEYGETYSYKSHNMLVYTELVVCFHFRTGAGVEPYCYASSYVAYEV